MDKPEELIIPELLRKHNAALQNHRDCIQDIIVVLENLADRVSKLENKLEVLEKRFSAKAN
jgi:hypothetical protein